MSVSVSVCVCVCVCVCVLILQCILFCLLAPCTVYLCFEGLWVLGVVMGFWTLRVLFLILSSMKVVKL